MNTEKSNQRASTIAFFAISFLYLDSPIEKPRWFLKESSCCKTLHKKIYQFSKPMKIKHKQVKSLDLSSHFGIHNKWWLTSHPPIRLDQKIHNITMIPYGLNNRICHHVPRTDIQKGTPCSPKMGHNAIKITHPTERILLSCLGSNTTTMRY